MSQDDWLENLANRNESISEVESVPVDRDKAIEQFIQTCRKKRDTMLEYHLFLNYMEDLSRKKKQPTEKDFQNMKMISDKVYSANKDFIQGLDGLDGTECWASMRNMMDDQKED